MTAIRPSLASLRATVPAPKPAPVKAPPVSASRPLVSSATWSAVSGDRQIRWDKTDILVRGGGQTTFSAKAYMARELGVADYEAGSNVQAGARVKSVVGGVMSLEWNSYYETPGAAHPGGETRFAAINLAKPDQPVKLTDMFDEKDVLKALLADSQVKAMLKRQGVKQTPRTLDALFSALNFATVDTKNHSYSFNEGVLSQFAIHHVEGDQAYVRLGMQSASGADRYAFGQLGLKLPIPAALQPAFAKAQKDGAVAQALDRIPASKNFQVTYMGD